MGVMRQGLGAGGGTMSCLVFESFRLCYPGALFVLLDGSHPSRALRKQEP